MTNRKTFLLLMGSLLLLLPLSLSAQTFQFPQVESLTVEVLERHPHDTEAFTQGLLWYDGSLYESTGQRGESTLREVDLTSGDVLRSIPLTRGPGADLPDYFGEGLERIEDRLIQLTWTAGEAFVYELDTFEEIDRFTYEGEGWGLCYDGRYLVMSDGTPYLSIREADTFELIAKQVVTLQGQPIQTGLLNELECVGEDVYANLWQTDFIARIDRTTGAVTGIIDASSLLTEEERAGLHAGAVLNGIAYDEERALFYVTGKDWPALFEVNFVPAQGS